MKVAIQGLKGSFHHIAASKYFKSDFDLDECSTFRALALSLSDKKSDLALMAIENSIAGSILPNYSLLEEFKFKVIGEIYLRIEMNLIGKKGTTLNNFHTVESHPMALHQIQVFLQNYPNLNIIESNDTALSVKNLNSKGIGFVAVGSELSAKVYNLEILSKGIETNKKNYTRFLCLTRNEKYLEPITSNKATLRFQTSHLPGSLAKVLSIFSENEINLTKIQSVPVLGKTLTYSFHCDLIYTKKENFNLSIKKLKPFVHEFLDFGEYEKGEIPSEVLT